MSHWTGRCGSPLYHKILKESADRNEGEYKGKITKYINPEKLKTLYLEMLEEAGVKIMLYTFACDAIMDENTVKPFVYKKWQTLSSDAKILFIAPLFAFSGDGNSMADESYDNPIRAFEAGFFFDGGGEL
jgi:hypothetical protein